MGVSCKDDRRGIGKTRHTLKILGKKLAKQSDLVRMSGCHPQVYAHFSKRDLPGHSG